MLAGRNSIIMRSFCKDLGIIDAAENDIDAEGKLCIYSYQDQIKDLRINPGVPFVTMVCSYILYENSREMVIQKNYVLRTVQFLTTFGWLALLNRSVEKKKSICRMDLLRHPDNPRYSAQVLLTRLDGYEWIVPIKEISHTSNNDS